MEIRRRDIALFVGVTAVNTAFALSDRAATFWGGVSDSLGQSKSPVAEVITSTGVTTSRGDWAVHLLLWGSSSALVVCFLRRARRYVPVIVTFLAVGGVLELLQNVFTIHRAAQWTDMAGNVAGVCSGVVVGHAALAVYRRVQSRA